MYWNIFVYCLLIYGCVRCYIIETFVYSNLRVSEQYGKSSLVPATVTYTTAPPPSNGSQHSQAQSVLIASQNIVVSSGGVAPPPSLGNNGNAPVTIISGGGSTPSPPAAMSGSAHHSPNQSPSVGPPSSTGSGVNGIRSSGSSGKSMLTGNAEDYQNYTMSRIITEALERSNVGCGSPPPTVKPESSLNSNNGTTHVPATADTQESSGAGQKRPVEDTDSVAIKPGGSESTEVEDSARLNSDQASKRMKVET